MDNSSRLYNPRTGVNGYGLKGEHEHEYRLEHGHSDRYFYKSNKHERSYSRDYNIESPHVLDLVLARCFSIEQT